MGENEPTGGDARGDAARNRGYRRWFCGVSWRGRNSQAAKAPRCDRLAAMASSSRILLSQAHVTELEAEYVLDALRSGWVAPLGPHVDAFEKEIAQRVGIEHALALSSGTAALHLALLNLGIGPGSHVLVSSMTFAASANAIAYTGATPVFIDSQASDGNIDPELLIHAIDTLQQEGKEVGAVMSVDLFGRCCDYPKILPALAERGIPLLEDAAEALGANLSGQGAGSFGKAAALSFNGNKIMTTSGGGMLLSDDPDFIARARYLATQARQPVPWYEHTDVGYNYRLSNLLAALGRAQLKRLDEMIARRREIRKRYQAGLGDIQGTRFLGESGEDDRGSEGDNCWLTTIAWDPDLGIGADQMVGMLNEHGIEARHLWKPMHLQPMYREHRAFCNGVSEGLFGYGAALPSGSMLGDEEVDRVIGVVREVLGGERMA